MKNCLIAFLLICFQTVKSQSNNLVWYNDLNKALPVSIKNDKPLLLFFTGSDWCGWCMRLKKEVFNYPEFKEWTDSNVVMVELDFPRRKKLDYNILNQNRELARVFGVSGYPTVWLVKPQILESSKVNFLKLGKLGYVAGGPEKWISVAQKFLVSEKKSENINPKQKNSWKGNGSDYKKEINNLFDAERNIESQTTNNKNLKLNNKIDDIDNNIPLTTNQSENTYALIIGNEDYSTHQTGLSSEVNVNYATNDAEIMKKYCNKTLGVPEKHIMFLKDATAGKMKQGLGWINNLAKVTDGKANLIFYYAGHGLPDEITNAPYLMPVDVSGSYINLGISLDEVINSISQYPTNKSVIFLDACFSGGARNEGLVAMRGVKIKPKEEKILGNLVVFSSSSGNESSGSYEDKKHGMFTYFLLKKLQESKGSANLKQLSDYVYNSVRKESALSGKIQTPQVQYSSSIGKEWEGWTLLE
jgi:thioredoxin-related protein